MENIKLNVMEVFLCARKQVKPFSLSFLLYFHPSFVPFGVNFPEILCALNGIQQSAYVRSFVCLLCGSYMSACDNVLMSEYALIYDSSYKI